MRRTRVRYGEGVRSVGRQLDLTAHSWVDRMPRDLSRLRMDDRRRCVLGFAFGDFLRGRRRLARDNGGRLTRWERRCTNPMPWRVRMVTELWQAEIRRRRSEQDARVWPEAEEILR